jgi:hypothetical protein
MRLRDPALVAAGALAAAGGAHAAGLAPFAAEKSITPVTVSARPTGVGLPVIGSTAYAASDVPSVVRRYHDTGGYARDIVALDRIARNALRRRLGKGSRPRRPAIVLDIDETSLSNYASIAAGGFAGSGTGDVVAGTGRRIAPTLALARYARRRRVALFFVTGRPPQIRATTERNLRAAGYAGWRRIYFKPVEARTATFKARSRAAIERAGYRILVNVGDQESDLAGGHAAVAIKLPNPFYFVP